MFNDESTKNFTIIVQDQEIHVHKFILFARSELFQGMFLNVVNDLSNKVSDYTGRTYSQINSIIRILYFDKFDSETDSEVIDDFQDIIDYYQLNSRFIELLNQK
ncbi:hypothetical protein M0811_01514 [Anaeramoeba ignava]|uniref:BTB domain-containing protein n=1 Tax=Anaeramoeba ignava TaxID=1746090 RepID=A0A9Q0LHG9_ANAIG|nr:hypothetical protein M0811_01514 [Anaeramoeba ignava]